MSRHQLQQPAPPPPLCRAPVDAKETTWPCRTQLEPSALHLGHGRLDTASYSRIKTLLMLGAACGRPCMP